MRFRKGIFLAVLSLCSCSVLAVADEVQPQIIASIHDVDTTIQKIDFRENGTISIVTKQDRIVEHQLSVFTATKLAAMVSDLAKTEVLMEVRPSSCDVVRAVNHPTLRLSRAESSSRVGVPAHYTGRLRMILSDDRCTELRVFRPLADSLYRDARELRDLLIVLGNEVLSRLHTS